MKLTEKSLSLLKFFSFHRINKSVSSYEIQKIRRLKLQTSLVEQIKIICLQEGRGFQQAILLVMDLLLQQLLQLLFDQELSLYQQI